MNKSTTTVENPDLIPTFQIDSFTVRTEEILFYYEMPIFCLCKSARDRYYLAYCYEPCQQAWILAQVSRLGIVNMFDNKIAIDALLQNAQEKWIGVEDTPFRKIDQFHESELPKKDAMYGRLSSLELDLIKRLTDETIAINRNEVFFTKKQLVDSLKNLRDDDRVQVQINFDCDVDTLKSTSHYKGTMSCERITGVEVSTIKEMNGMVAEHIADINIDLKIT
jgi:hypothetical protein